MSISKDRAPMMKGLMRARRRRWLAELMVAGGMTMLIGAHSGAMAQTAQPVPPGGQQLKNAVCATNNDLDDEAYAYFVDKLETPGQRISLASFPPAIMTKLMALQKAEVARSANDWPDLCRYASKNAELLHSGKRPRVVFIGDSITDFWRYGDPGFFSPDIIDRGISGQTTPQILLRFYADVVALRPRAVHILAGVNDLAGNTGPSTDEMILNNIRAMIDIAKANNIKVVLASLLPANVAPKQPGPPIGARLVAFNEKLRRLAGEQQVVYLDYHAKLLGPDETMPTALTNDGLHPNRAGYAVMRPLAEGAIARALH
jgi:lysophospholipase L1-like esterase